MKVNKSCHYFGVAMFIIALVCILLQGTEANYIGSSVSTAADGVSKKMAPRRSKQRSKRTRVGRLSSGRSLAAQAPATSPAPPVIGGTITNNSSTRVWVTAGNKKHCLNAGESSSDLGITDADGILLDGRRVFFDSSRTDLGGGTVHSSGAIKLCDLGSMTIVDDVGPASVLQVSISTPGFICPGDAAGYKDVTFCRAHTGWDIDNVAVGRPCP